MKRYGRRMIRRFFEYVRHIWTAAYRERVEQDRFPEETDVRG